MKADTSLAERRRVESDRQQAVRAALIRRHVQVTHEQHALEAAQVALDIRQAPAFRELAQRMRR